MYFCILSGLAQKDTIILVVIVLAGLPERKLRLCILTFEIIILFCRYDNPDIALNCGVMLRECIKHEPLAKIVLESESFYSFYTYVELSTFDIASDAFSTFKVSGVMSYSPSSLDDVNHVNVCNSM